VINDYQQRFANTVQAKVQCDQITLEVAPSDLIKCCLILRDEEQFQFNQLIDLCAIDYLTYGTDEWATQSATSEGFSRGVLADPLQVETNKMPARFAVVYNLLSTNLNQRVRLKVFVAGEPPRVSSITQLWPAANWYEREAFDLFGILFDDHPDLRRILTDYGFIGHPFRKDFPLIGQVEMRYDATEGRVVYEPVSIKPRTLVPKVIRLAGQTEHG
jgi:NADH-quinone oxidoreductase subunit C